MPMIAIIIEIPANSKTNSFLQNNIMTNAIIIQKFENGKVKTGLLIQT